MKAHAIDLEFTDGTATRYLILLAQIDDSVGFMVFEETPAGSEDKPPVLLYAIGGCESAAEALKVASHMVSAALKGTVTPEQIVPRPVTLN